MAEANSAVLAAPEAVPTVTIVVDLDADETIGAIAIGIATGDRTIARSRVRTGKTEAANNLAAVRHEIRISSARKKVLANRRAVQQKIIVASDFSRSSKVLRQRHHLTWRPAAPMIPRV